MASHPSPFHRQRQSTKSLDPTGQTAKFLYTILKQLDLKNIDWNEVASSLEITNGHAARMRWSRFRAQIEGLDNSYSRKGGRKKEGEKKRKKDRNHDNRTEVENQHDEFAKTKRMKTEAEIANAHTTDTLLLSGMDIMDVPFDSVKHESTERPGTISGVRVHHPSMTTIPIPTPPVPPTHWQRHDPRTQRALPITINATPGQQIAANRTTIRTPAVQQWSQQVPPTGSRYPYHSNVGVTPYFNGGGTFTGNQQYHHFYPNQFQQRRPNYQQPFGAQNQAQFVPQISPTSNTAIQSARPNQYKQSATFEPHQQFHQQSSGSSTLQFRDQVTSQQQPGCVTPTSLHVPEPPRSQNRPSEKAYELASEASYPWPFSEASLQQFETGAGELAKESNDTIALQSYFVPNKVQLPTSYDPLIKDNNTQATQLQSAVESGGVSVKKEINAEERIDYFQIDPIQPGINLTSTGGGETLVAADSRTGDVQAGTIVKTEADMM